MDGLEVTEVPLSMLERTWRIDSMFYSKSNRKILDVLSAHKLLSIDPCLQVSDGNHMSISDHFTQDGIPYYRGGDIYNFFIEQARTPYCIPEEVYNWSTLKRSHLKKGDILVSIVGAIIGNVALVMTDDKATCSCKLAILRSNGILSEFVAIYLKTKYGQNQIQKFRRGGGQTGLILDDFSQIFIPDLSKDFQIIIKHQVLSAYNLASGSVDSYSQAENYLLSELGMGNIALPTKAVAIKSFVGSFVESGRLDAEYYQPKYDKLFDVLAKFQTKPLGGKLGIVDIKKSIEPGSSLYQSEGIPFIRVSDVIKFGISEPEIHLPMDVVPNVLDLYPQKDTILFSKDGSVGIAYKIEHDSQLITSGALLHLTVRNKAEVLPSYLTLVLNSIVVQLQAERDSSGAIIQHWKPSEVEKVVIPVLDMDIQREISSKVQESFALRQQSEQLLENAKRAVEIAIEYDEEKAMEWLKDKAE